LIPAVIPPLSGLSVLVTRPQPQSDVLADRIRALGGEAFVLPAIQIRPLVATVAGTYDLVVFVSVNAVEHGAHLVVRSGTTRVAAIGKTTAAALAAIDIAVDIVPERGFTSEALLAHPQLTLQPGSRVLIVRGAGGRELLQQTFSTSGVVVETLDVYERALPVIDGSLHAELDARWLAGEINAVTATSVETLANLKLLLSERSVELLRTTPLVVPSPRVCEAAAEMGLLGECIVATGADDSSIVGALSLWHARARTP
jgi:uroporphyrinogen-III synthase